MARIMAHWRQLYIGTLHPIMMSKLSNQVFRALALASTLVLVACTSNEPPLTPALYADDAGTTARVRIALMQDPHWRPADLQITTEGGLVHITGSPPPGTELGAAELQALVSQIDGVRETEIELSTR